MATQKLGPLERCVQECFVDSRHRLAVAKKIAARWSKGDVKTWTAEEILVIALFNGLVEMERRYCKSTNKE